MRPYFFWLYWGNGIIDIIRVMAKDSHDAVNNLPRDVSWDFVQSREPDTLARAVSYDPLTKEYKNDHGNTVAAEVYRKARQQGATVSFAAA